MSDPISEVKKKNAYYKKIVDSAPPKTPVDILADFGITKDSKHHNYDYVFSTALKMAEIYKGQFNKQH